MKSFAKGLIALSVCVTLVFGMIACSNGSDMRMVFVPVETTGGNDRTQTQNTPPVTYTITFNANDGSEHPATATQLFTAGAPQNLKTFAELGFSKRGFNFAGWGKSADATQSFCADGASYTATASSTLYALWSEIPVYSVVVSSTNNNGTVNATPATGITGTEITLSSSPAEGYQFVSYSVIDADGGEVTVTDGKFAMPAKNVTVTAKFAAINYNIIVGTFENGSVTATPTTATVGTSVALTISPASGYNLETLNVTTKDGILVTVNGSGNSQTFTMPAKNVTVTAIFVAIKYNISVETFVNGNVEADKTAANYGDTVTLTIKPAKSCKLEALTVKDTSGTVLETSESDDKITFIMPASNVTVKAMFAASGAYTEAGTTTINGIEYGLVTFGLWPQTIKADDVDVSDECESKTAGNFIYYRGSDGGWYAKIRENASSYHIRYSDGTTTSMASANSEKWFKVEPIKWRVLTTNYNETGRKLLLAESILTCLSYYDYYEGDRNVGENKSIFPNNYEHSKIRAFLNGLSYPKKAKDDEQIDCDDFLGKGFLQTAFTAAELDKITNTSVDNSARTTFSDGDAPLDTTDRWNGIFWYASDIKTTDKVFLLSLQEVTTNIFGFEIDDNNMRCRKPTDFAKANGALSYSAYGDCASWLLRSPYSSKTNSYSSSNGYKTRSVTIDGKTNHFSDVVPVDGVVPALCVGD